MAALTVKQTSRFEKYVSLKRDKQLRVTMWGHLYVWQCVFEGSDGVSFALFYIHPLPCLVGSYSTGMFIRSALVMLGVKYNASPDSQASFLIFAYFY
jgi:hypothetical protein